MPRLPPQHPANDNRPPKSNVAPGGWAEFQDYDLQHYSDDNTLKPEHDMLIWDKLFLEAAGKTGREVSPGPKLEEWVKSAGFVNVHHEVFKFPIGPWAKDPKLKEVGLYNLAQLDRGLEAFTLQLFTGVLKWGPEAVHVLLSRVRKDFRNPDIHAYFKL